MITEAEAVVDEIFEDLRDRSFLKWMFDRRGSDCFIGKLNGDSLHGLDLEVQVEIRKAWGLIIQRAILTAREKCAKIADEEYTAAKGAFERSGMKDNAAARQAYTDARIAMRIRGGA